MAAKDGVPEKLVYEVADLWFHSMVLLALARQGLNWYWRSLIAALASVWKRRRGAIRNNLLGYHRSIVSGCNQLVDDFSGWGEPGP